MYYCATLQIELDESIDTSDIDPSLCGEDFLETVYDNVREEIIVAMEKHCYAVEDIDIALYSDAALRKCLMTVASDGTKLLTPEGEKWIKRHDRVTHIVFDGDVCFPCKGVNVSFTPVHGTKPYNKIYQHMITDFRLEDNVATVSYRDKDDKIQFVRDEVTDVRFTT